MSLYCQYCHSLFCRKDSGICHKKHSWQSSGSEKTREDVPNIRFPTEHLGTRGIEMGEVFRFKTPSSILVVGPCFIFYFILLASPT